LWACGTRLSPSTLPTELPYFWHLPPLYVGRWNLLFRTLSGSVIYTWPSLNTGVTFLEILVLSEVVLSETWIQYKIRGFVLKIQNWQQKKFCIVQTWSVFIKVSYNCLKLAKSYYVYAFNKFITFKLSKLKVGTKLKNL